LALHRESQFANFENSRRSTKNCQFVLWRGFLKRRNISTLSRRLDSSENGPGRIGLQLTRLEIHLIGFTVPAEAF